MTGGERATKKRTQERGHRHAKSDEKVKVKRDRLIGGVAGQGGEVYFRR